MRAELIKHYQKSKPILEYRYRNASYRTRSLLTIMEKAGDDTLEPPLQENDDNNETFIKRKHSIVQTPIVPIHIVGT